MNITKLKKAFCDSVGFEDFRKSVLAFLTGVAMFAGFMWMVCDWINIVVARGY